MRDRIARYTVPGGTVYCCIDARFDGKVASLVVLLLSLFAAVAANVEGAPGSDY
ncbi:hypothetical protein [Rhodococcus qingshengii]|uniref:hypothetical protein n=1 Tax=Rhodococcus qingshengii TaxID=334542 RepID=UPI001BE54F9A|nr:hypothetical protein [Rhodococcus qingshengii]MBT2274889.1 hypothetical protein [Rhodococcus qingshengii]